MPCLRLLVLASLTGAGLAPLVGAAPAPRPRTTVWFRDSMGSAAYTAWIEQLATANYRPVLVSAHTIAGKPVFAALAVPNSTGQSWLARHGLSLLEHQRLFDEQHRHGYRPYCVAGYLDGETVRYASLWVKDGLRFYARHGIGGDDHLAEQKRTGQLNYRPHFIHGFHSPESTRYATAYVLGGTAPWLARHGLSISDCRATLAQWSGRGYRPVWAAGFWDGRAARFNLILERQPGTQWRALFGLTARRLRRESDRLADEGYELAQVSGYADAGRSCYLGVWARAVLPATGKPVPELSAFDEAMRRFMWQRDIHCATLAVMKDGKIVLRRGYGFAGPEADRMIGPDDPFRLASVGKPITAAAIRHLIRAGKLRLDTRVFALLGAKAPPGQKPDPRLQAITIAHLLEHTGGWDRAVGPIHDPMFPSRKIALQMNPRGPPDPRQIIRYMVGQPLQFEPGTKAVYSNFGYCVLGRVIEKVGGRPYIAQVRREVLAPLGLRTIDLGRTLPRDRDPREPTYRDPYRGPNVVGGAGDVSLPDGGFHLEAMDSHGGLIGSAPDLVRFCQAYWFDGRPRKGNPKQRQVFFGRLPGTWALIEQRPDGINLAALFAQSHCPPGLDMERIADVLDEAVEQVRKWP